MGIRLPLQTILDYKEVDGNTPGASSVAGGIPKTFLVPQDTDNVTVKLMASVSGGGYSATVQTSDDGGTTWYDVARTSVISNTGLPAGGLQNAEFLSIPVVSGGVNTRFVPSLIATGSLVAVAGGSVGKAGASTLASGQVSGLPLLGALNRVFLISVGTITATSLIQVQVKVNSQTPNA